jgi:hypothetical protein
MCPRCKRQAVGPKSERWRDGEPIVIGRFTSGRNPMVVKCFRCGGAFKVDALAFNSAPEAEQTMVEKLGL